MQKAATSLRAGDLAGTKRILKGNHDLARVAAKITRSYKPSRLKTTEAPEDPLGKFYHQALVRISLDKIDNVDELKKTLTKRGFETEIYPTRDKKESLVAWKPKSIEKYHQISQSKKRGKEGVKDLLNRYPSHTIDKWIRLIQVKFYHHANPHTSIKNIDGIKKMISSVNLAECRAKVPHFDDWLAKFTKKRSLYSLEAPSGGHAIHTFQGEKAGIYVYHKSVQPFLDSNKHIIDRHNTTTRNEEKRKTIEQIKKAIIARRAESITPQEIADIVKRIDQKAEKEISRKVIPTNAHDFIAFCAHNHIKKPTWDLLNRMYGGVTE